MINQYPWASVKAQERKHIEIGMIVTMLVGIITFYSVPTMNNEVTYKEAYMPPPVEVISIPATVQPPEKVMPASPSIPVESENEDIDLDLPPDLLFELKEIISLVPPMAPPLPNTYLEPWMVSDLPVPIGGYGALMRKVIYPEIAREAGVEGIIYIEVLIGKDGLIKEAKVARGIQNTGLDEAALTAVLQTTFKPALQMGKPVPVRLEIPIKFRLN